MRASPIFGLSLVLALGATALPASALQLVGAAPLPALDGLQVDAGTGALSQSFVSSLSGTVESVVWWGFHGVNSQGAAFDNFIVKLDGTDQTGALTSATHSAGLTRYELDIVDLPLLAGIPGTLEIVNDSDQVEWFWQYADANLSTQAYALMGTAAVPAIPEPETWALMLMGLAALGSVARRSQRNNSSRNSRPSDATHSASC